jgi:HK97 family phage major capsid protein
MNTFSRKNFPALAILAAVILIAGGLAYAGVIDPSLIAAAPLMLPLGHTAVIAPNAQVRVLLEKRAKLSDANLALLKAATDGSRDITAEEKTSIDANLLQITSFSADINRYLAVAEAARAVEVGAGVILETRPNILDDPKRGFKNMGDFALSVRAANPEVRGEFDKRLTFQAATPGATYSNESAGADGGFLVPTEFATNITKLALGMDNFLGRSDAMPVSGNSISFPSDETTPWGSNGVRAYWAAEAAAATATKPIVKQNIMRLNKLFGLVPVTDEALADAPFLAAYLEGLLARSINWKVNDALVNGTGAGMPLGILKGAGLAVVNKDAGQATLTLSATNITNMYAAMPVGYLDSAEWIIGPDTWAKLIPLTLGNFAIFTPPMQGFAPAPGGYLLGKPVTISQTAAAFTSQGDVIFTNFKAYRTISKDGVQIASSMHLYFDADTTAFRATFRLDGQPTFKSTIAQARGAQALSPYVTLQAR